MSQRAIDFSYHVGKSNISHGLNLRENSQRPQVLLLKMFNVTIIIEKNLMALHLHEKWLLQQKVWQLVIGESSGIEAVSANNTTNHYQLV